MLKPLGMSSPLADFVAVLRRQVNEADLTQLDLPESTGRWLFWGQWMVCRFLEVFFPSLTSQKTSYKSAGFCSFLTSLHISSHLFTSSLFFPSRQRAGWTRRPPFSESFEWIARKNTHEAEGTCEVRLENVKSSNMQV